MNFTATYELCNAPTKGEGWNDSTFARLEFPVAKSGLVTVSWCGRYDNLYQTVTLYPELVELFQTSASHRLKEGLSNKQRSVVCDFRFDRPYVYPSQFVASLCCRL